MPNEHDLLKKARDLDPDSLGLIYDAFSPGLYRYAMRLLGDNDVSEDCVADTFSRYLAALHVGHGPDTHLQAYLYRIAHNWITDFYRRNSPVIVELDETLQKEDQQKPENWLTDEIQKQQIRLALRALTPDQRQVVILRFIEEWSTKEVAVSLQKPVGAIKALQHRGLEAMRNFLSSDEKVSLNEPKK
ncbi:MAG: sigma-70 family RNA polymerase sigma factor [Anaerolineaceae bacterium]|nr:sigma-70 family RNA polymerase sigma factor [Anaerolineaceae bacterium]